jgi:8-oxo-dGTP diphosphatase
MNSDLAAFLRRQSLLATESAVWGDGVFPLRLTSYLVDTPPPVPYITSVRCIVLKPGCVLTVRNARDHTHILPGGRREPGEAMEETLRREVLEETGWEIQDPALLGLMHFHHLSPKPGEYPYPHPDFLQTVYVAGAGAFIPDARMPDGFELEATFRSIADVERLGLPSGQRLFLQAARDNYPVGR